MPAEMILKYVHVSMCKMGFYLYTTYVYQGLL